MRVLRSSRNIDFADYLARIRPLAPKTRAAHADLAQHYWTFGALPREDHDLAAICGLHVASLRRMKVQLGWVFEVDETGLWRDYELEAERAVALDISAKRAASGLLGAVAKQARARGLDLTPEAVEGVANSLANATPFASDLGVDSALDALANATPFASAVPGSGARVEDDDDDESERKSEESSSSSSSNRDPREAGPVAGATPFATPAPVADARPAEPPAPPRSARAPVPTKREVLDRVARALNGRARPGLCSAGEIGPIMRLLHDGFDLERHVIPVLTRHTKEPLKTFAAPWIRVEAERLREAESEAGFVPPPSAPARHFVCKGTPQWDAWMAYRFKADGKSFTLKYERGGYEGWDFDAPWPPGYEPARAAAAE